MSLCLSEKKSLPSIKSESWVVFIFESDTLKWVGLLFNSLHWLPTKVSNRCTVSIDSGVTKRRASSKLALVRFSTNEMAIASGPRCRGTGGAVRNKSGSPMARVVSDRKIMRTRVLAFIVKSNYFFAFCSDNAISSRILFLTKVTIFRKAYDLFADRIVIFSLSLHQTSERVLHGRRCVYARPNCTRPPSLFEPGVKIGLFDVLKTKRI